MTMRRRSGFHARAWGWAGCAALVLAGGVAWAEGADEDSSGAIPAGFSCGVEATTSFHHVSSAYFGADYGITDDPAKTHYTWGEGFTRVRANYHHASGLWGSVGGVLMGTTGADCYGVDDAGDGLLDQLLVGFTDPGPTGLSLVVGRQDLQVGDGFLVGDGYRDSRAALWNIPLNFYDAVRLDWARGPWHALAFGARLSPSYGAEGVDPEGQQFGGEVGWAESEQRGWAVGFFQRKDDGGTQIDARATSLRGSMGQGPYTVGGEWVFEGGTIGETDLWANGGHVYGTYRPEVRWKPYGQLEYFYFSGDDPKTGANEAFFPWEYRWTDWSRYYVADLTASTLVFNSDARIWKLELGCEPREGTGLRLLLHRVDLVTGTSYGELARRDSRAFADEADLVVDQSLGDHWSAWVMGAYVRPLEAAKALVGTAPSGQVFASLTFTFDMPGGGEE